MQSINGKDKGNDTVVYEITAFTPFLKGDETKWCLAKEKELDSKRPVTIKLHFNALSIPVHTHTAFESLEIF